MEGVAILQFVLYLLVAHCYGYCNCYWFLGFCFDAHTKEWKPRISNFRRKILAQDRGMCLYFPIR